MTDLNRVFFPLRSNIGWFQTENLRQEIETRIKQAILIYDELYIEDGTYELTVLENGGASSWYHPPGSQPEELRTIEYERDIKTTTFTSWIRSESSDSAQPEVLQHGVTAYRFKIDYADVFRGVDFSSHSFLKRHIISDTRFPSEATSLIRSNNFADKWLYSDIETNSFLGGAVIEALNRDLITSALIGAGIILDPRHQNLLVRKAKKSAEALGFVPSKEDIAVRRLLSVRAPDFATLSIKQVLELREDELWKEWRNFVSVVLKDIITTPDYLVDIRALEDAIGRKIEKTLFDALEKKHKNGVNLSADLIYGFLGLIPGFGLPPTIMSAFKSFGEWAEDKSGWFAFLLKVKNRSEHR